MPPTPFQPGSTHSSVLEGIRDPANRTAWERFFAQYAPYVRALDERNPTTPSQPSQKKTGKTGFYATDHWQRTREEVGWAR